MSARDSARCCDSEMLASLQAKFDREPDESCVLTIENDNPAWVFLMRYGEYIRRREVVRVDDADHFECKVRTLSKAGRIEFTLAPGSHVLHWDGVDMFVEVWSSPSSSSSDGKEGARIRLPRNGLRALESFLYHARALAKEKTSDEAEMVVSRVFKSGVWRQTSAYPKRRPESLVIPDGAVDRLVSDMRTFRESEDVYARWGFAFKRNYLIVGPPGCGKSSLVVVAASAMDLDICYLTVTGDMSERDLCAAVSTLTNRSMLVIEDAEVLCSAAAAGSTASSNALAALTNVLDGTLHRHGLITVVTSAHPHLLEDALVRNGRVDLAVRLRELTREQVVEMAERMLGFSTKDASAVAGRIWKTAGSLKLTSTYVAHFLFDKRDLAPEAFTEELCRELAQGTHMEHVLDSRRQSIFT